ncbi:hypothetical protein OKW41_002801 [Paraburkholderia sp. UCT70]
MRARTNQPDRRLRRRGSRYGLRPSQLPLRNEASHEGGQALPKPIHLSTTGPASDRSPPWLKTRSARWLKIHSARTVRRRQITSGKLERAGAAWTSSTRYVRRQAGIESTNHDSTLFELQHLVRLQPRVLLLPAIKGLFRYCRAANQLGDRHPCFRLSLAEDSSEAIFQRAAAVSGQTDVQMSARRLERTAVVGRPLRVAADDRRPRFCRLSEIHDWPFLCAMDTVANRLLCAASKRLERKHLAKPNAGILWNSPLAFQATGLRHTLASHGCRSRGKPAGR